MTAPLRFSACAPGDIDLLEFDLSLNVADGATVADVSFSATPSNLTFIDPAINGTTATVWFTGASRNTDYTVFCTFQTSDGKTRTRSAYIFCGTP